MENPADKHIADLIEHLTEKAQKWNVTSEDRAQYIKEIAQLRSSMNPKIIQKKD